MNITMLTPGAAGMYCGGCMRDNALVSALRKQGHDALLVPLYTPLLTDEPDNSNKKPIFFGGINAYLQQHSALFRKAPKWVNKLLDAPSLLRMVSGIGVKTDPQMLGDMTVSMLRGEDGFQARELEKLTEWLAAEHRGGVLCFSNALLLGMAKKLKQTINVRIACTLQGEDYFVDGFPESSRQIAWDLLADCARHVDVFIPVSRYYGDVMARRMKIPQSKMRPVWNGIELNGYPKTPPVKSGPPVIAYMARFAPEKGFALLCEAFIKLCKADRIKDLRLKAAGSLTTNDKVFFESVKKRLNSAGVLSRVEFLPNISREGKISLLSEARVLSVPAEYGEAFGLFMLEGAACGTPYVLPRHGAFPEIHEKIGGGYLADPGSADDLAAKLEALLLNPDEASKLGAHGFHQVREHFTIDRAAKDVANAFAAQP